MKDIKVSEKLPPNYDSIVKAFPFVAGNEYVVFTYGDTVYNVHNPLTADLTVHESTHTKQQGDTPDFWWAKYLKDADFRLEQELEAYSNQYEFMKEHLSNKHLKAFLFKIAQDFSSSIYNLGISHIEAETRIRNYKKHSK